MQTILLSLLVPMLGADLSDDVVDRFSAHEINFTGGPYENETFQYRLLEPLKIEPGKAYPVVFFLHGAGERGDDNRLQLKYLPEKMSTEEFRKKYPCYLIAPQCRAKSWWASPAVVFSGAKQAEEPAPNMQVAINILLNVLDNHPVDRKRVYLTGLSMGGYGSWDLAARHPEWFAAVVPICGGGDSASVARLVKLPVWAIHGDADPVVPVSRTRQMIEALREAGGKPHYSELPDVGHNSWTPGYDDPQGALPWMFQQVNAQAKQPRGS